MPTRKKQTIVEEVIPNGDDSPSVIAYRVKKLEDLQAEGFKSLSKKLDDIASGFATKDDLIVAQKAADKEHEIIYERIADAEKDILAIHSRRWVQNTLSAILGAVIAILVAFFLQNIGR